MEAKSLLLVLELDHLAGLEKALQSHRGERIIFYGPSKLRARTGKSIGHGTQVGVKAGRFCVDQLVDRAARIVGEVLCSILMTFPSAKSVSCQTQNYLRIVQRYLRMVENFAMLHYSLRQRAPPENHCVLMAASLKLLPGSTVRWRGRRYLIVDYQSLDAIIARQPGKRSLERIPVNEAAPENAWQTAVKRFEILKSLLNKGNSERTIVHVKKAARALGKHPAERVPLAL